MHFERFRLSALILTGAVALFATTQKAHAQ